MFSSYAAVVAATALAAAVLAACEPDGMAFDPARMDLGAALQASESGHASPDASVAPAGAAPRPGSRDASTRPGN
jgi:hypothetical protein